MIPMVEISNQFVDDLKKLSFLYKEVLAEYPNLILNNEFANATSISNEKVEVNAAQMNETNSTKALETIRLNRKSALTQQVLYRQGEGNIKKSKRQ